MLVSIMKLQIMARVLNRYNHLAGRKNCYTESEMKPLVHKIQISAALPINHITRFIIQSSTA